MAIGPDGKYIPEASDYQYGGDGYGATVQDPSGEAQAYFTNNVPSYEDAIVAAAASNALMPDSSLAEVIGNYGGYTTGSKGNATTLEDAQKAKEDYASAKPSETSLMDKLKQAWDWAGNKDNQKNPLLMMGLMGLSNAQNNANKREMADRQMQNNLDVVNAQYANQRKTAEDNSAAIMAIPKKQGIIQSALKRIDGTQVFNPNGTVKA